MDVDDVTSHEILIGLRYIFRAAVYSPVRWPTSTEGIVGRHGSGHAGLGHLAVAPAVAALSIGPPHSLFSLVSGEADDHPLSLPVGRAG